jgi:amphi-Trp domain-containing protein
MPVLSTVITQNKITPHEDTEMKEERDIEKTYSNKDFVAKLRRLADAIENGKKFEIQIAGERIYIPVRAEFNIEHEREATEEEIEFQIKSETFGVADRQQSLRAHG